jgi:multidrug transporter EmrE-like cation transporter
MNRSIILLILAIVLNASANVSIKIGMLKVGETDSLISLIRRALTQPILLLGVALFALALFAYCMVLIRLRLCVAYPIMVSMSLVIVVLASFFIIKETITLIQIIGFLVTIAGVWMVAR